MINVLPFQITVATGDTSSYLAFHGAGLLRAVDVRMPTLSGVTYTATIGTAAGEKIYEVTTQSASYQYPTAVNTVMAIGMANPSPTTGADDTTGLRITITLSGTQAADRVFTGFIAWQS